MPSDNRNLALIRDQIDSVDQKILELINKRSALAQEVAVIKKGSASEAEGDLQYYRPDREAAVLDKIAKSNKGPCDSARVIKIFREIMSLCLSLESELSVAFLGPQGTYTEEAALKQFGGFVSLVPEKTIRDVFLSVETGRTHYGVVPIENSTEGSVGESYDSLITTDILICSEVLLPIDHCLLSSGVEKGAVLKVYGHSQALAQCRTWLSSHYPKAALIAVSSNAEAAVRVTNEWESAAIASERAADIYGLQILHKNIADQKDNATRFIVLGRNEVSSSFAHNKTIVRIITKNRPGVLCDILIPFQKREVDLTNIETRPSRTSPWEYVFFLAFKGHRDEQGIQELLAEVQGYCDSMVVMGSFAVGPLSTEQSFIKR